MIGAALLPFGNTALQNESGHIWVPRLVSFWANTNQITSVSLLRGMISNCRSSRISNNKSGIRVVFCPTDALLLSEFDTSTSDTAIHSFPRKRKRKMIMLLEGSGRDSAWDIEFTEQGVPRQSRHYIRFSADLFTNRPTPSTQYLRRQAQLIPARKQKNFQTFPSPQRRSGCNRRYYNVEAPRLSPQERKAEHHQP